VEQRVAVLLSRVAENLYWAARYLERAEDTARIVREHTNLIVDLPTRVPVTWEPLLAITGSRHDFDDRNPAASERSVIRWLIADRENHGSVLLSVESARENLRSSREVLPSDVWQGVNDLYLYVAAHHGDGVARSTRARFLERIVGDVLAVNGTLTSTMSRDEAFEFLRIGRNLERADMATRVLDVRAGSLMAAVAPDYEEVQWLSVLRCLSGQQMFRRTVRGPVSAPAVLQFLLHDSDFPRSVRFSLDQVRRGLRALPRAEQPAETCERAVALLDQVPVELGGGDLHHWVDELQIAIGAVHLAITETYFTAFVPAP
jgi:uncharacterized alpha-E superfamily protein